MKTIITGATGFVGRNLALRLHHNGVSVIATGRSATAGADLESQGIRFAPADLLNPAQLNAAFEPADCAIHCAAVCGPWGRYQEFHEANVLGTRHVIAACRQYNIKKVIFISTPSVYYDGTDRLDIAPRTGARI